jgi:hypothetical protein
MLCLLLVRRRKKKKREKEREVAGRFLPRAGCARWDFHGC